MAKSLEVRLNEGLEKLKATSPDKFNETWGKMHQDGISFRIDKQVEVVEDAVRGLKESRPRIDRKNGAEVITESAVSQNLSEAEQFREKSDELMYDAMNLSEADRRKLKNLPPVGVNLTSTQLREFRLMRSYRINESDAVRLALKVA
jgi:hypothetical protein